jgi:arylsulfatase A-like enzyme
MMAQPDIVLILADDMGYSDLGCYGGEADTPALDGLARGGVRMTQFYTTPRCSPSRASLLTGLQPHQVGVGILNDDDGPEGYPGNLSERCVTIAEVLKSAGYATFMSGKWHVSNDAIEPNDTWPTRRGFDRYFGSLVGSNYFRPRWLMRDEVQIDPDELDDGFYYTDAISANAVSFIEEHDRERGPEPFFLHLAHRAPHWPLQAPEEDVAKYRGCFDKGWDRLRQERLRRMVAEGLLEPSLQLSDRDPAVPDWDGVDDPTWEVRRMEVYAAQIDRMDQGIARILATLNRLNRLDNTLVIFLSDNGGCAEELPPETVDMLREQGIGTTRTSAQTTRDGQPVAVGNRPDVMPGPESTFQSYGRAWANLSNTPFREYKHWVHEGGVSTPFIVSWPTGIPTKGQITTQVAHITDLMPTLLEAVGATYPAQRNGQPIPPLEGRSILSILRGGAREPDNQRALCWEHEGNCGVRRDKWKLVKKYGEPWELYDIDSDRTESDNLAGHHPQTVAELVATYEDWAARCGVIPRDTILGIYARRSSQQPVQDGSRTS